MIIKISCAPCCWGIDNIRNPYLPDWKLVLEEANKAGYTEIELGPYGYIPLEIDIVKKELKKNNLSIIAGTIFDNLVEKSNLGNLIKQTHDICSFITKLSKTEHSNSRKFNTPYLVIIDWGHEERDYTAGHPNESPRLGKRDWNNMMTHIKVLSDIARQYNIRPVVHPHAGGYIEFGDEIDKLLDCISYETAGLCLDTGHLYYSKMDPEKWLKNKFERIDYIHFRDINKKIYNCIMNKHIKFLDACEQGVMCPIGKGDIDYKSIKNLLENMNYNGYITIEYERDPRNCSRTLKDIRESLNYLNNIGY